MMPASMHRPGEPRGDGKAEGRRLLVAFYATGYDCVVSIEHEDRQFEGSEALVKRGFSLSRNVFAPLIV